MSNIERKVKDIGTNNIILQVGFLTAEMAQIAIKNEYGGVYPVDNEYRARAEKAGVSLGDTIHIIPRPFMTTTVKNNQARWRRGMKKLLETMKPEQALGQLGEKIKEDIMATIISNNFERNPPKIARIKGNNRPLIDSGEMLNSVEYKVRT